MKTFLESMLSQLLAIQAERENQFNQLNTMSGVVNKLEESVRLAKVDLESMKAKVESDLSDVQYAAEQWRSVVAAFPET